MKQYLILFLSLVLFSCSSDSDELIKEVSVKINFSQNWDNTAIEKSDLVNTEFTNKPGTKLTIERLRYLISRITLTNGAGEEIILTETRDEEEKAYKLVDLSDSENLTFNSSQKTTEGIYKLSMNFGFNDEDNNENYLDLNIASWDASVMSINNGYHFMQLEGKFLNNNPTPEQQGFTYHTIRAYNTTTLETEDTSFTVDLGTINLKNNAIIEIKMNVASWFKVGLMKDPEDENLLIKDPKGWDLNELNSMLMGNYDAQKQMSANGKSGVFSLGTVTQ